MYTTIIYLNNTNNVYNNYIFKQTEIVYIKYSLYSKKS